MFAIARIVGWSAHRLEELINVDKIIRPAYISISETGRLPADGRAGVARYRKTSLAET